MCSGCTVGNKISDVIAALQSSMSCGVLSCGSVRSTRGIVALIVIPQRGQCYILHSSQSLSMATLDAGNFTSFNMLKGDMEHWPQPAMWSWWVFSLLIEVRTLCDSLIMFLWSCFELVLDQSFAQGRSQLEPFGLTGGDVARHRWGTRVSFSRCVQLGFFLCPLLSRMVLGLSVCRAFPFTAERTQERPPFHPSKSPRFPQVPFRHRRSRAGTLEQGSAELCTLSLRGPDCTLSRLSFFFLESTTDRCSKR